MEEIFVCYEDLGDSLRDGGLQRRGVEDFGRIEGLRAIA
ncbi:MAG: hypothetical protein SBU_000784 [Candidatus Syntrophoarchaeum butanivorans]|uniref:Uncharacterized protein n=1 Tax=Candidatus Syntropharchaeum butanivorans TaxID=1839936 RepID=A0A1F2P5H4_9EURY|nr:MAG: hypothetical protein SBU_000784 [Candidatus Syntrophoarchaeum butanivorans]